jgi:hypothetical protein
LDNPHPQTAARIAEFTPQPWGGTRIPTTAHSKAARASTAVQRTSVLGKTEVGVPCHGRSDGRLACGFQWRPAAVCWPIQAPGRCRNSPPGRPRYATGSDWCPCGSTRIAIGRRACPGLAQTNANSIAAHHSVSGGLNDQSACRDGVRVGLCLPWVREYFSGFSAMFGPLKMGYSGN